jgi:hypothetical protein
METENKVVLVTTIEQLQAVMAKVIATMPAKTEQEKNRKKLTRSQAARFCGISYHTFGKWTREGKFRERGFGRKKFYYEDELIEALNRKGL